MLPDDRPQAAHPHPASAAPIGRLGIVAALLLGAGACGFFAGSADPATTAGATPASAGAATDEDAAPTCRPAGDRGPSPWSKGDTVAGWTVSAVDTSHREFARYTLSQGEDTTGLELRFHEGEAGDWTTTRTALMPAPEEEPPQAVLDAAIAHLRTFDAAHTSDPPFLARTEGQADPYDGLPPCPSEG